MSVAPIKQSIEQKMSKSIEALKTSLGKIRTGRAHAGLLDHITVDYYGSQVPINQVANVTVLDARTIGVQAWEKKMGAAIDKAIRESDLGLNPSMTGELIRVPMPPLSEERRRELTKVVRSEGEDAKVAIRNIRRDQNEKVKAGEKDKKISEDESKKIQDEIQKITDNFIKEVDKIVEAKEKELLTV
jgi:ribosome recycling factor